MNFQEGNVAHKKILPIRKRYPKPVGSLYGLTFTLVEFINVSTG